MPGSVSSDWIASPDGTFVEELEIREQKIGVVGINTAWLSMNDADQGKLTPGIPLTDAALEKIKNCDVRFVLGHHPLHWFVEDEADSLRAMFGYHNVIYLHGHMHRPDGRRESGAGEDFLMFQGGAAFQAHDDEVWKNGLTLGEIDCKAWELRLSPHFWNPKNYDWPVETGRFPEKLRVLKSDWWAWPLPGTLQQHAEPAPAWEPPEGWEIIDAAALQARLRDVTADTAAGFFDGAEPDWAIAQSSVFPRRGVVSSLCGRIAQHREMERSQVTLLIGPGGEGKSMALRQAIVSLVERVPNLGVLWRLSESSSITADQLLALPVKEGSWIVATDSADLVAIPLHAACKALSKAGRSDIAFLLASRDSDWRASGASRLDWRLHSHYHEEPLSGLSLEDAKLITSCWETFGATGLCEATGESGDNLAKRLQQAAIAEASAGEGALLGGMLALRHGRGLRGHVKSLLDRLAAIPVSGSGSVFTAFRYISAMHAEGFNFLSRPVLAEALGCDFATLQREVLFPLGQEAAGGGGTLLSTRHRKIAVTAIEIMRDDYGEAIEEMYIDLAKAATIARAKFVVPEFARWRYDLPQHFLQREPNLAVRIGRALLDKEPNNPSLAVNLARLFRESSNPKAGAEILSAFLFPVGEKRGFWQEWGACSGSARNAALSACLLGWAIADQPGISRPENDRAKMGLASLGVAFQNLYLKHGEQVFLEGRGAAGYLGLRLHLDAKARTYFERYLNEAKEAGIVEPDQPNAFLSIVDALRRSWELCGERESITDRVPNPAEMTFSGLESLFSSEK
jgi:hypothetical protein